MSWWCVECGAPRLVDDFPTPCPACGSYAIGGGLGVEYDELEPRLGVATLPDPEPEW